MHQAAFNLGLLVYENDPKDSFKLISKAYEISPNPRYAFTMAYFMNQAGDQGRAEKLQALALREWPWYADSYLLLADIHLARKEKAKAKEVLQEGIKIGRLKPRHRQRLLRKLSVIK